jgi:hypothetical protein
MAKSISVDKKRRGRPPTGSAFGDPIPVRLPPDVLKVLARYAEQEELKQSEVIRMAVADYLKRKRALPR